MNNVDQMMAGIGSLFLFLTVVPFMMLGLAVPYLVIRLRETKDPMAGLKVGLQFFFSTSVLLVLTGFTILLVDLLERDTILFGPAKGIPGRDAFPNPAQRTAFALILSGLLFATVHFLLIIVFTRDAFSSPVRRTFLGWRFAIHGMIVMIALTFLLVDLFRENNRNLNMSQLRIFLGILIIWTPSWLVHLFLLRKAVSSALAATRHDPLPMMERDEEEYDDDQPRRRR